MAAQRPILLKRPAGESTKEEALCQRRLYFADSQSQGTVPTTSFADRLRI